VLADLLGSGDFTSEIAHPQAAAEIILQRLADAGFAVVPAHAPTEDELAKFIYSADDTAPTASAARTARAILQRYRLGEPA
jgi:hypothetical protein